MRNFELTQKYDIVKSEFLGVTMPDFDDSLRWSAPPSSACNNGPMRICRFCILGVLFPVTCLFLPLYVRVHVLGPRNFALAPADMKLLNQAREIPRNRQSVKLTTFVLL